MFRFQAMPREMLHLIADCASEEEELAVFVSARPPLLLDRREELLMEMQGRLVWNLFDELEDKLLRVPGFSELGTVDKVELWPITQNTSRQS